MAVRFAPSILKLPNATSTLLLYPDGMVAAHTGELNAAPDAGITYEPITSADATPAKTAPAAPVSVSAGKPTVPRAAADNPGARNQPSPSAVIPDVPADTSMSSATPNAVVANLSAPVAAAAGAPVAGELSPAVVSTAGASALVLLGAAGVLYSRPRPLRPATNTAADTETSKEADEDAEDEGTDPPPNKEVLRRRADLLAQDFTIRDTTKK